MPSLLGMAISTVVEPLANTENTEPIGSLTARGMKSKPVVFNDDSYVGVISLDVNPYVTHLCMLGNVDQQPGAPSGARGTDVMI